ncbi:TIGR04222 domain-containing membrane protein [Gemmata sp. G18]|uniref:TIGR04222 domain-containing membrane protein n=1 Tax=Gemmata palustris TaxID=2822762 RepID=A0ABS5BZW9_9BACT|nr:TIGR04222 domain-containing membrane protein [Gemmata palustris]MBP3959281.1 TIGR04222 domain-containing membrane protein [Gemmata palustris]
MSPDRSELLARVLAFDIDGDEVALPFAARLAREQGWSRTHTDRVIEEYKRYVFLAVTAGITVCPSEDVDAAWHMHLTYTKSYWKRFCGEVLGRPLHHEPTKGGPAEGAKHFAMYAETLTAYREAFGRAAPANIWPAGNERFGDDTRHRVVNVARNWVIPKAPVKRVAQLTAAFVLIALAVPGCNGGVNPFELKNKEFLTTLGCALVAAVCIGRVVRSVMRTPDAIPDDEYQLDWEQTAYLAGGAGRLMTAAVARLVGRDLAHVGDDGKRLIRTGPIPDDISSVERAVLQGLPVSNDAASLKPIQQAVDAAFARNVERLEEEGITIPKGRQVLIAFTSLMPLAVVLLCLSLPRLLMGLDAKKPVEYLVATSIVGGVFSLLIVLAGSGRLSHRGRALLAEQKERCDPLRAGTRWENSGDAGMAVALFGTAVLAGTAIAPLQTWYPRQTNEASSGGCGGSSGCGVGAAGGWMRGGCGGD